jgi:hypothetical protein
MTAATGITIHREHQPDLARMTAALLVLLGGGPAAISARAGKTMATSAGTEAAGLGVGDADVQSPA